jgi:hypothetical protein
MRATLTLITANDACQAAGTSGHAVDIAQKSSDLCSGVIGVTIFLHESNPDGCHKILTCAGYPDLQTSNSSGEREAGVCVPSRPAGVVVCVKKVPLKKTRCR